MFCRLERETFAGCLSGHLTVDGEDAASQARNEVADVRVGAVDDVLGGDCASGGFDSVGPLELELASVWIALTAVWFATWKAFGYSERRWESTSVTNL